MLPEDPKMVDDSWSQVGSIVRTSESRLQSQVSIKAEIMGSIPTMFPDLAGKCKTSKGSKLRLYPRWAGILVSGHCRLGFFITRYSGDGLFLCLFTSF